MSPEDLHALVEEYRDGTLGPADAKRLADAIRADRDLADRVRHELEFSGHLAQAVDGDQDAAFVRSFAERLSAETDRVEFVTAFEKRTRPTQRTRRHATSPASPLPFLIAAGILLAIVGLFMLRGNKQPQVVVETRPEEPVVEVPRPEAPKPPLPAPPAPKLEEPKPVELPRPPAPVRPEEPPKVDPPIPVEPEKPKAPEPTRVAKTVVARLDKIEGEVRVDGKPAAAGQEIDNVSTGLQSRASVVLADGTRLGLEGDAAISQLTKGAKGTRIHLTQGALGADVARQPAEQPLIVVTPHGEVRVLGTVFRLVVEPNATRLEVKEGKVRLTRESKSVDVAAGQYATAGGGLPLAPRSLSPDEIVLTAPQAKLTGNEWTLIRDPKGLTGAVLEAGQTPFKVVDHVETRPAYATFTFFAPADKEYRLWLRGTSQEKGDPWLRDLVTIEPTRATLSQKSPFFGAAPTTAYVFTGLATTPGYTWMSGHGEEGKAEAPPLVVKFAETGWQNIRVYVGHPWVRVDTLWLSATQKTRPPARQLPPPTER